MDQPIINGTEGTKAPEGTEAKVVGQSPVQEAPTAGEKKSSNSPVVVTITVMVIVALGVAGFIFVKNNNSQTETTATTVTQPTSAVVSPTINATDETQIDAIDIGDTDTSDLTSVEKDINSL